MNTLTKVFAVSLLSISALCLAQNGQIDLRAKLSGAGAGRAEWKSQDRGARMRAELEVRGDHLAAGADFQVTVGSNAPMTVTTDNSGSFDMDVRFNGATRPVVNTGDSVTVSDATDTIVLTGVLQSH